MLDNSFNDDQSMRVFSIYSDENVITWKELFEKIGTFKGVSKHLRSNNNGKGPDKNTIQSRLKKLLSEDYDSWYKKYKSPYPTIQPIYNQSNVHHWKTLYEKYGNLAKVCNELKKGGGKSPANNTIKRKLKELLKEDFAEWYDRYKLAGKYNWDDIRSWKNLYEQLHNFQKVGEYIKRNNNGIGPHEENIRKNLKKYLKKLSGEDYDEWVKKYSFNIGNQKYTNKEILEWKKLFEKYGTFKETIKQIKLKNEKNPPNVSTIKERLRNILGNDYEKWRIKHLNLGKYRKDDVLRWKSLFQKYGTFDKVSELTGHDDKTLRKYLKELLGDDYDNWYKKFSQHRIRVYSMEEIAEWKSLFEELGSFNAVSDDVRSISGGDDPKASVIRKIIKRLFEENGKNYDVWLKEFSLSDRIVLIGKMIHQILEYYFMLRFKDTNIPSFYEITPTLNIGDLFLVDNALIKIIDLSNFFSQKIPDKIVVINIDYTITSNLRRIYHKFRKGYHDEEMWLIVVPLFSEIHDITIPLDIPNKENIKIINSEVFFKMMGYNPSLLRKVKDAINLSKRAIYDLTVYTQLIELAETAKNDLKNMFGDRQVQQSKFKHFLRKVK